MNLAQHLTFIAIRLYYEVSRIVFSSSLDAKTEECTFKESWEERFERFSLTVYQLK